MQSSLEKKQCNIGVTDDLEKKLKECNKKENIYKYLFACEVKNMKQVEKDIAKEFSHLRKIGEQGIYLYGCSDLFNDYVNFIKSHKMFVKEENKL